MIKQDKKTKVFDVVIIGAGPAGTASAFDLSAEGLKVLILDKYEFPRKKACAGGITPKAYHLFKYDISSLVKRKCRTIKIHPANQRSFLIKEENPFCYMVRRDELDFFSLNKVMEKGAQFKVVKTVHSITEKPFCVEIHADSEYFKASYLIGADGANSIVRRFISKDRFYKKLFAIEADVKIKKPGRHEMEFDFSKLRNCYFWIFPKDDHVNIGIYSIDPRIKPQTRQLSDYAGARLLSRKLDAVKGYPVCTGGSGFRPDSKRIFLAGDAAGLAEPLFGEGIYSALISGQMAAAAILESEQHAISATDVYREKLKHIRTDLKIYDLSARWFYRFPNVSLKIVSFPFIHKRFSKGYAGGKTIAGIFSSLIGVQQG